MTIDTVAIFKLLFLYIILVSFYLYTLVSFYLYTSTFTQGNPFYVQLMSGLVEEDDMR